MTDSLKVNRQESLAVVEYRQFDAPWLKVNPCHLNMFSGKYIGNDLDLGFCGDEVCGDLTLYNFSSLTVRPVQCRP